MFLIFLCALFFTYIAGDPNPNQYCAELNPQPHVDIEQLMGMWYGIEIISHKQIDPTTPSEDYEDICPVIYISEDKTTTTLSPLHKNYNYGQTYGSRHQAGYRGKYDDVYDTTDQYVNPTYDPDNVGENYEDKWARHGTKHRQHKARQKRLRILWDESGNPTEFTAYYATMRAGVWYSSGPQNGSSLAAQFNNLAGIIQVLKAVGNHLVLTFCHRLPDEKLYTVLLSRVPKLSKSEVQGVHNLLVRRGLETTRVRKVCTNNASSINFNVIFTCIILICAYIFS